MPVLVPVLVFGNGNERPTAPVRLFEVHVAIGEERLGAVVVRAMVMVMVMSFDLYILYYFI